MKIWSGFNRRPHIFHGIYIFLNNQVISVKSFTDHWIWLCKRVSIYFYLTEMHGIFKFRFRYGKGSRNLNTLIKFLFIINIYHSHVIKINLYLFRFNRTFEEIDFIKIWRINFVFITNFRASIKSQFSCSISYKIKELND